MKLGKTSIGAARTRYDIALLLARNGRVGDALHYARAALHNYQQAGAGAASDAAETEGLIALLEERSPRQANRPHGGGP